MRDAGSLLVRAGLIDSDALAQARSDRAKAGGTLAEHLVLAKAIGDTELTQFFRERLMVPKVSSNRLRAVPKRVIDRIPAELAGELRVVPVALDSESSLTVAMSDPSDTHALDELEFFTEHYVVRAVASQAHIAWCLDHYYGLSTPLLAQGPSFTDFDVEPTNPYSTAEPTLALEATLADLETSTDEFDTSEVSDIHPHLDLEAEDPTSPEHAVLEDGSPVELAPRVGEVLVNLPGETDVGTGPAVVLDDSLFVASNHKAVSFDDEKTGEVVQLEADEPGLDSQLSDGRVSEPMERGTDSAPILLSAVKQAAELAARKSANSSEPALVEVELVDEEIDEDNVVLLEQPRRQRPITSLGVGAPLARAAKAFGLRTSEQAEHLAVRASERLDAERGVEPDEAPPMIIDDREEASSLSELTVEDSGSIDSFERNGNWDASSTEPEIPIPPPRKRRPKPSSLTGVEATAVAELDSQFASQTPVLDVDDQDRVLDTIEQLARADHRDQIVAAVLDYLDQYCARVVFLALKSGALVPFQIRSSQPIEAPKSARLPLREVSLLRDIVDTRLPYRGLLEDEPSQKLLMAVFGELGADGLAVPVAVRGRVVGLLYGDGISPELSGDNVGLVTSAAGRALERTLKR